MSSIFQSENTFSSPKLSETASIINSTIVNSPDDDITRSKIPKTTAFTVHFDNDKKFTKRHVRNLSLPLAKLYDEKIINEKSAVNNKTPDSLNPSPSTGGTNSSVGGSSNIRSSRSGKAAGNHSEGYFSSDAEDDSGHPKQFVTKLFDSVKTETKLPYKDHKIKNDSHKLLTSPTSGIGKERRMNDEEEGGFSDNSSEVSETGTYTIEKENDIGDVEVITARLNIDNAFVINKKITMSCNNEDPNNVDSANSSLSWVNDWATHVVEQNSLAGVKSSEPVKLATSITPQPKVNSLTQGSSITKIPSPISSVRAQFRINSPTNDRSNAVFSKLSPHSRRSFPQNNSPIASRKTNHEEYSDSSLETESFLLATEKVVSAMAARVSLSMDSGGESDVDTSQSLSNKKPATVGHLSSPTSAVVTPTLIVQSDSSASESGGTVSRKTNGIITNSSITPTATTRYNRAFSLRRGRLDEPNKKENKVTKSAATTPVLSEPVGSKLKRSVDISRHTPTPPSQVVSRLMKSTTSSSTRSNSVSQPAASQYRSQFFTRTDCGRFSMRTVKTNQSSAPAISSMKSDIKKKGSGGRSNSTLSSREVEFQNWKRRKSYDPMKAAAEGKKKEAAKKQVPAITSPVTSQSKSSSGNPVLRSASFHGTRQLTMPSSSEDDDDDDGNNAEEEDEEEVVPSASEEYEEEEEEDWPTPAAPRTSLESTPRGSRVSLYSTASNSSLRTRAKLEGVDNLVITSLSGLSGKVKMGSCNLLKKLRHLYDEDSPKFHQLTTEIELLEAGDPGSPHHTAAANNNNSVNKSPSRELSTAFRNLKRIESVVKVIDNVLFDNEDFH